MGIDILCPANNYHKGVHKIPQGYAAFIIKLRHKTRNFHASFYSLVSVLTIFCMLVIMI